MKSLFPMFVKLDGRQVLVVGAGRVGEPKIRGLLATGAWIRVVALEASAAVRQWAQHGEIILEQRGFVPADLDNVVLAVVATASRELNELVFREARARRILCNVVDVPDQCDFYYPAVVQRGDLQIAISTSGQSPSLAQKLRKQLERQFGPGYARWVAALGETRRKVLASSLNPERKRDLLQSLASTEAFEAMISTDSRTNGRSDPI
jgi:precorrin-2 dehydrogenase/sirohydrochlorin ferrochelatase